jgi:hypothetical protein
MNWFELPVFSGVFYILVPGEPRVPWGSTPIPKDPGEYLGEMLRTPAVF